MWSHQIGFYTGQLSKGALSQVGTSQYDFGSTLVRDGTVTSDGNLKSRPGTTIVGEIDSGKTACRLIPFEVRGDRPYVFEVTPGKIRVWDARNRSLEGQEFTVPYDEADLPNLHFSRAPNALSITTTTRQTRIYKKGRSLDWTEELVDESLIISPANQKTTLLRTDVEPPIGQSYSVFSGPDGSAQSYFETGDENAYFRFEDGWFRVLEVKSAFEVEAEYVDVPPPFSISTTNWVGPFAPGSVDETATSDPDVGEVSTFIRVTESFLPGELIEIEAVSNDATITTNGTTVSGGGTPIPGYFQDTDMGGLFDLSSGQYAEVELPSQPGNALADSIEQPFRYVVQLYDVRGDGSRAAGFVVRVFGGSITASDASPRYFIRGPRFLRPEIRDVPNRILQSSEPTGATTLYSNADVFGSLIVVGDVLGMLGGAVRVNSIENPNRAQVQVIDPLAGYFSTDTWGTGTNASTGFPRTCAFHQNRLALGGVPAAAGTVFVSRTGVFNDFRIGGNQNDGLALQMTSSDGDSIQWLSSMSDLRNEGQGILGVGTDSAEFRLAGSLSPLEGPSAVPVSFFGSRPVQPAFAGTSLLFVTSSGETVRDLRLFENVEFPTTDITIHATDQFQVSEASQIAFLRDPFHFAIVLRKDKTLTSCSYQRELGVNAWIPWTVENVETVCAVKREADPDEAWMVVARPATNDQNENITKYYVEVVTPDQRLDGAVVSTPTTGVVTGLEHFEGEEVTARSDGVEIGKFTVSGGGVNIPPTSKSVSVGRPSLLRLAPLVNDKEDKDGSTFGRSKQASSVRVQTTEDSAVPGYKSDDKESSMTLYHGESFWYQADALSDHYIVSRFEILAQNSDKLEISGLNIEYDVKDV